MHLRCVLHARILLHTCDCMPDLLLLWKLCWSTAWPLLDWISYTLLGLVLISLHLLYLEKEMATHSSTLAWRIPWREEPGRLQSMGSQRVRHN